MKADLFCEALRIAHRIEMTKADLSASVGGYRGPNPKPPEQVLAEQKQELEDCLLILMTHTPPQRT